MTDDEDSNWRSISTFIFRFSIASKYYLWICPNCISISVLFLVISTQHKRARSIKRLAGLNVNATTNLLLTANTTPNSISRRWRDTNVTVTSPCSLCPIWFRFSIFAPLNGWLTWVARTIQGRIRRIYRLPAAMWEIVLAFASSLNKVNGLLLFRGRRTGGTYVDTYI